MKQKLKFILLLIFVAILSSACAKEEDSIFLTQEERTWIDEHEGQIRIGYTTDYPPVEFLEEDTYVGMSADYFSLLEEKLQIDIKMVRFENWSALLSAAETKQVSGITAATKTEDRSAYLEFTVPYIMNPNVIITRKNFSGKLSFEKLTNASMKVLVVEGYSIIEELARDYPKLEYETVLDVSEGMRKVSFGEADALIVEIMSAAASIERDHLTNLVVNTEVPYDSNLSIAVRNDWPILKEIFNKGLAQISDNERQEVLNRWVPFDRQSLFENRWFWITIIGVVLALVLTVILVIIWNYTLQKAVREKTYELEKSKEELLYKSYHDALTGLYNRAYFNECLADYDREEKRPLAIILADLNGLKLTNDTLGHFEGDRLLVEMARILKKNSRAEDMVARIGGDEFVVLLPNADEFKAREVCRAIQQDCMETGKDSIQPSVALGYSVKIDEKEHFQVYFKQAEDSMYEKKMEESEATHTKIMDVLKERLKEAAFDSEDHSKRFEYIGSKKANPKNRNNFKK